MPDERRINIRVQADEFDAWELELTRRKLKWQTLLNQLLRSYFNEESAAINPDADYALDLLAWLRNPGSPDKVPFCQFVLAEFDRARKERRAE